MVSSICHEGEVRHQKVCVHEALSVCKTHHNVDMILDNVTFPFKAVGYICDIITDTLKDGVIVGGDVFWNPVSAKGFPGQMVMAGAAILSCFGSLLSSSTSLAL